MALTVLHGPADVRLVRKDGIYWAASLDPDGRASRFELGRDDQYFFAWQGRSYQEIFADSPGPDHAGRILLVGHYPGGYVSATFLLHDGGLRLEFADRTNSDLAGLDSCAPKSPIARMEIKPEFQAIARLTSKELQFSDTGDVFLQDPQPSTGPTTICYGLDLAFSVGSICLDGPQYLT